MFKKIIKTAKEIWNDNSNSPALAITLIFVSFTAALAGYFGILCLRAWIVMLLWNWVAVSLFNAPVLSFWLAFGMQWLFNILVKNVIYRED